MTRLTMLFIAVALVLPGAALAMPAADRDAGTRAAFGVTLDKHGVDQAAARRKAEAVGAYYASFRATKPEPIASVHDTPLSSVATAAGSSTGAGSGFVAPKLA